MSLDVGLVAYKNGEVGSLDQAFTLETLGDLVEPDGNESWSVLWTDRKHYGGTLLFHEEESGSVTGFSMNRPPFSRELLGRLLVILRQAPSIFWWPDPDVWACSADPNILAEVPEGTFDRPEQCIIVSTVDEFAKALGIEWDEEDGGG
jgi:hypothetical protein